MTLKSYNEKRNFSKTPEPKDNGKPAKGDLRFVVQRHQASTLHYDFRLEAGGVLKSWAVPKGPSLDPADKRLAMEVEDHPFAYRTFEGDIPEGNYGAGHVDIWDEGTFSAEGTKNRAASEKAALEGLENGSLSFVLNGHKLKGEFALVKMKGRQRNAWLLIKKDDKYAQEGYNSEDHLESVTGKKATAGAAAPEKKSQPAAGKTATATTQNKSKETAQVKSKTTGKDKEETKAAAAKPAAAKGKTQEAADKPKAAAKAESKTAATSKAKPEPKAKPAKEPAAAKPKKPTGKAAREDDYDEEDNAPAIKVKQKPQAEMPHQVEPMMAKLTDSSFNDPEWIFETKWDGFRAIAEVDGKNVELYSRNLKSFNARYPSIVKALGKLSNRVVLDGEIVVTDAKGKSSFQQLQNYQNKPSEHLRYYIFDLLYIDGEDLRDLPLTARKERLEEILPDNDKILFYSEHTEGKGDTAFKKAQKDGLEGIMAKKADSTYRTGRRTSDWLKIKTHMRQEAIIVGFTEPKGSREHLGALALAVYEKGKLQYVGNAGTGFDKKTLQALRKQFGPLIRKESPFAKVPAMPGPTTWLEPELVAEISFAEWTNDGLMRHPVYEGLREDKPAKDVVREKPEVTEASAESAPAPAAEKEIEAVLADVVVPKKAKRGAKAAVRTVPLEEEEELIGRHRVKFTNLSKVYWPEEGYTKRDIVNYYRSIGKYIMPYLKDRPQSLLRHPNGISSPGFFQKDVNNAPEWVQTESILAESTQEMVDYLVCQNEATLAYMNNLGCIQLNPWNSRISSLDYPDYMVIDLDPGENTFDEVIEAALVTKETLDRAGVESYCKTSGATGMHVYVPLGARYDFDQAKDFAHAVAEEIHADLPDLTSLERSPKARRKLIYLDFLQNAIGQTIAAPYSLRPKPGAPVSMPLLWKEVKPGLHPSQFHIKNALQRLEKMGDIFEGVLGKGIDLPRALENLGA